MTWNLKNLAVPVTTLALALAAAACWSSGFTQAGTGAFIRLTAGSSLVLFALAWSASSLHRLLPDGRWRPVMQARRQLGIAFAISHSYHLLGIVVLFHFVWGDWSEFEVFPGPLIYAAIYAMAFTSNDASVRALGKHWKRLHTVGGYLIWVAFTVSYVGNAVQTGRPQHYLFAAVCVALLLLRVAAWRRQAAS